MTGILDVTREQLLSLGQFLPARQADILSASKSAARDTLPDRADSTARGPVTALLLDQLITAVERHPAAGGFSATGVIAGNPTRATTRHMAIELSLLRRVVEDPKGKVVTGPLFMGEA